MFSRFPGPIRQKERGAFTLIELMVVCMLLVILTAVIVPEMRGSFQDSLLRATSRNLVDAFDLAYSHSVSRDEVDRVRLDVRGARYIVEQRVETQGQENFKALTDVTGAQGDLDNRISIEVRNTSDDSTNQTAETVSDESAARNQPDPDAANAISFYSDGTADDREVVLRDQAGFGLALQINPITARVKIVDLPRK
jgi:type II secretory pathway pseudopilin PulG